MANRYGEAALMVVGRDFSSNSNPIARWERRKGYGATVSYESNSTEKELPAWGIPRSLRRRIGKGHPSWSIIQTDRRIGETTERP